MANSFFPKSPDQLFGQLFYDVQLSHIFTDSKTFVDSVPKLAPDELMSLYELVSKQPEFDLEAFVREHFEVPLKVGSDPAYGEYVSDRTISTAEHIDRLWDRLTRQSDPPLEGSSRVPLPYPYIVPGGRFREIFYWDSYFTMLGLNESGRLDLVHAMLDNFAYLIDLFGFIPNGNRTYFLSRSQPPCFSLMVGLLADISGQDVFVQYQSQLQREYDFWMEGHQQLTDAKPIVKRVVRLANDQLLNRYWDSMPTPRPEAYRQEIELAEQAQQQGIVPEELYTHIRAACESGWDFSSRWFRDEHSMAAIRTSDIVPVDLNCLLYGLETSLHKATIQSQEESLFDERAKARATAIQQTFWNDETGFFHDYDTITSRQTDVLTLAGVFPLFYKLATSEQANRVHERLKADFLQAGGWVTTLNHTGQQWDWPNGWAPLQWIVYRGLMNYGFTETAEQGRDRWLTLNDKVFKATGKMMEKYNVVDAVLTTGGGEYPNQDGFGWTNGVYLALDRDRAGEPA